MSEPNRSPKEEALRILGEMDNDASLKDILFAIHQQSTLQDAISYQRAVHEFQQTPPKPSVLGKAAEVLGCFLPVVGVIAFFLAMPLLFSLGESIIGKPPRVLREGNILAMELVSGNDSSRYVGKHCRVLESHLEVDNESSIVIIPNAHFRYVQVQGHR